MIHQAKGLPDAADSTQRTKVIGIAFNSTSAWNKKKKLLTGRKANKHRVKGYWTVRVLSHAEFRQFSHRAWEMWDSS